MKKQLLYTLAVLFIGLTATAQIDRSKMPESGPTPEINMGKPYTFELKNGLQVLVVEDSKLPVINMSLSLDNPPIIEGDKAGVQSLTSSIMGKGTSKTPKNDFNEKVDYLGLRVFVNANGGFASGLSKYKEDIFSMFTEAALYPNFTEEELKLERDNLIQGLKSGENSAASIAGKVRGALVYGKDHAAGEFATVESVESVTLDDVKNFYNTYFKPSRGFLVISGDITKKEAKKLAKKYFDKQWEEGLAPKAQLPAVQDLAERQINFVDVPNAVQTELAVMHVSDLKMNDPDYHAAVLANYILGGGFNSYVNMNLREEHGWTYGARTSLGSGRNYKSTFRATTKVRNEVTDSAVVEIFKEINRLKTEDVDPVVLENAKAKFLGSFIMQSEDKEVVADRAVTIRTNNLPEDFYKNFIKNINAVTVADVKRVANKYLKPEQARIVLVGKASDVLENLEKMKIDGLPVDIKFFDKEANPTERPSTVEVPEGLTAQNVLDNYIAAIGGKEAVQEIKDVNTFSAYTSPMGELILGVKRAQGDKWSQSIKMGGREVNKQVYLDGKATVGAMGQSQELSGKMLELVKDQALFFPELYHADKATLAGAQRLGDNNVYIIKWSDTKKSFYDTESGLLVGEEVVSMGPQGEITTILKYSDYEEYNGVKFPTVMVQPMMGQELKFETKDLKVNTGLKDSDF
ncbi:insulinase family protein [Nonlabens sp. SCSIO 43208]|uniref:insulinase family protein n=1 Tax=Nonlabens TaxID=363408 RepID=UPI000A208837|nr:pitrilysin family protein [Nonlabens tegetincola]ARN72112.1 peptidase, M16 family protein [Nonlabens tegetincola]